MLRRDEFAKLGALRLGVHACAHGKLAFPGAVGEADTQQIAIAADRGDCLAEGGWANVPRLRDADHAHRARPTGVCAQIQLWLHGLRTTPAAGLVGIPGLAARDAQLERAAGAF